MVIDFVEYQDFLSFLEQFDEWTQENEAYKELSVEDQFSLFYQHYQVDKTPFELRCDLAFQIYHLQHCVEGLIEDMEAM